jgi:nucleoside-diphosphate-sugar epimerase
MYTITGVTGHVGSAAAAELLAALYDAEQNDVFHARGDRRYTCTTGIDETVRQSSRLPRAEPSGESFAVLRG